MARIDETTASGNRPLDLSGDSPELIAFGLLRYLAQLEQQEARQAGATKSFDRKWMLDAYAECLEAAKGQRKRVDDLPVVAPLPSRAAGRTAKAR